MASAVAQQLPRAGGLYILEATNASFASAQQVTLSGVAPATAYMVGYPYRDAGVLDTAALIQDPTFSPPEHLAGGPRGHPLRHRHQRHRRALPGQRALSAFSLTALCFTASGRT